MASNGEGHACVCVGGGGAGIIVHGILVPASTRQACEVHVLGWLVETACFTVLLLAHRVGSDEG